LRDYDADRPSLLEGDSSDVLDRNDFTDLTVPNPTYNSSTLVAYDVPYVPRYGTGSAMRGNRFSKGVILTLTNFVSLNCPNFKDFSKHKCTSQTPVSQCLCTNTTKPPSLHTRPFPTTTHSHQTKLLPPTSSPKIPKRPLAITAAASPSAD